jgi:hypothetical protein
MKKTILISILVVATVAGYCGSLWYYMGYNKAIEENNKEMVQLRLERYKAVQDAQGWRTHWTAAIDGIEATCQKHCEKQGLIYKRSCNK